MEQQDQTVTKRGFKRKPSRSDIIFGSIWVIIILAFTCWVGQWWPLIFLALAVDVYYTKFINWGWWKNLKNPVLRSIMSWIDAIVFALVAVWFLQNFFFQNFMIPTTSLEKTMLAGDYLLVSKFQYGARVPMTPLALPIYHHSITKPFSDEVLCKAYLDKPQVAYKRLAGLGKVQRGDIVVFNFPAGDTVASKMQGRTYYDLVFQYGMKRVHTDKATFGDIIARPVDKRENYVKRCIGLPGDTLQIIDNQVFIDGEAMRNPKYLQYRYFVYTTGNAISDRTWKSLGVYKDDVQRYPNPTAYVEAGASAEHIAQLRANLAYTYESLGLEMDTVRGEFHPLYCALLTQEMIEKLQKQKLVEKVIPVPAEFGGKDYVYPLSDTNTWTHSNYGPIFIPKAGSTVQLNAETMPIYERCIEIYEGNELEKLADGSYKINGVPATSYTFQLDYYWMMGDNRDNSADSRYWGFVPEDHIVGTPLWIWISVDQETGAFRWDRALKRVKDVAAL